MLFTAPITKRRVVHVASMAADDLLPAMQSEMKIAGVGVGKDEHNSKEAPGWQDGG